MKKRNVMILVILLVIGFASVSTTLILNGTIGIASSEDDFDVIFTSAKINGEGASATIDETKKKITFTSSKLTSVGEKAILEYKIKNNSTQYDADVTINCTSDASEYISVTNTLEDEEIGEGYKTTFRAQEIKSGVITSKLIKSYTGEDASVEVTCTIVANATERDAAAQPKIDSLWKISEDNDHNDEISNGDLITLGSESFYVYDVEGDKVSAIAQYNLYVGNVCTGRESSTCTPLENPTGLQDPRAIGYTSETPWVATVAFDSSSDIYETSAIKKYVDEYALKLEELDNNIQSVRLITQEELEKNACDVSNITCLSAPSYIYSTSYWTASRDAVRGNFYVFRVDYLGIVGSIDVDFDMYFGVRPVIELSKSLFE